MTVTDIRNNGRGRYGVYTEEGLLFVLYTAELTQYGIAVGNEINEETVRKIKDDVLIRRAKLRAMNLLKKHSFSEKGLYRKLKDGGYPEDIASSAVEYVRSFGYIDDDAFAYDFITSHLEDKSIRRMRSDLQNKGISTDVIDRALSRVSLSEDPVDEESQIRNLLRKRHFDPEESDPAKIRKTYTFLLGRGYSPELIRKTLSASVLIDDID